MGILETKANKLRRQVHPAVTFFVIVDSSAMLFCAVRNSAPKPNLAPFQTLAEVAAEQAAPLSEGREKHRHHHFGQQ